MEKQVIELRVRIYKINLIGISIGTLRHAKIIFDKYKCYNVYL
jgi:hypothetical protein